MFSLLILHTVITTAFNEMYQGGKLPRFIRSKPDTSSSVTYTDGVEQEHWGPQPSKGPIIKHFSDKGPRDTLPSEHCGYWILKVV